MLYLDKIVSLLAVGLIVGIAIYLFLEIKKKNGTYITTNFK